MKNYTKNNLEIITFSFFVVLFIYSVRLFNYNIGVDTEAYLFNAKKSVHWAVVCGRFSFPLVQWLFEGISLGLNIFSQNLLACSFLIGSCLIWISIFRHYSGHKNILGEIAFCLFYLSSKVWVETIYFTVMAANTMFAIFLSPICVYAITEAITNKDKLRLFIAIILYVFITSVYQPVIVLVFTGLIAVYILRSEKNVVEQRDFWMIITVTIASTVIYFIINYLLLHFIMKTETSGYITGQVGGGRSIKDGTVMTGVWIYSLFFANNPFLNTIIDPMIENLSQNPLVSSFAGNGASLVEHFHSRGLHGCTLFFPATIFFLIFIFKKSDVKNKLLFRFSGLLFLCCALVMAVVSGGVPAERYLYALPLVTSFLFLYTLSKMRKKSYIYIWFAMTLIFGFYQAQNSSLLNVSDQKRYSMDKELARIIDNGIINTLGDSKENRKIVVFGNYLFNYGNSYLKGEVIGKSAMLWGGYVKTERPAMFMYDHGYNYIPLSEGEENKIDQLIKYAQKVPVYPNNGWVSKYNDIIVIKFSEQ